MPPTEATGIRNKNYLNVKNTTSPWMDGPDRESETDSRGHAVFTDPAYGIRAGILQLRSYFFKHDRRTIAEILERWAPASDTVGSLVGAPPNSPVEYSTFVAGRMGISFNARLDIFNEDKSVGNISRLRDLFYAMAEFENGGGFKVPDEEFKAGLELVQPGITTEGTSAPSASGGGTADAAAASTTTAAADPDAAAPRPLEWSIGGSVGRWDRDPVNAEADVETVQEMLRNASLVLREPRIDPGGTDKKIGRDPRTSGTVKAIEAFQSRFFANPDGLISVGGRTWRELLDVLDGVDDEEIPSGETRDVRQYFFPFDRLPSANWTGSPRHFGARRSGGRAHAACDLYFPKGTVIHAITDGTVVQGAEYFYSGTYDMAIDHGTFIARYGEIQRETFVRKGDRVRAGQPIAKVGHLTGISVESDMLHLELYAKTASGPLSVSRRAGAKTSDGRPFMRRKDLMDPTPLLNEWKHNLAGSSPSTRAEPVRLNGGIPSTGFCVHVKRVRQEQRAGFGHARTIADYQCYWNGSPLDELKGQFVERGGPGDNTTEIGNNRDLRIREGAYRLAIHNGSHYKTYGYNDRDISYSNRPNPGLLLEDTDERSVILIHPGEDYVKSVGCLNPTFGLADADSGFEFGDSYKRVVAIIEAMKSRLGARFPRSGTIPESVIIIEGEPG